jgi:hypothetical protein
MFLPVIAVLVAAFFSLSTQAGEPSEDTSKPVIGQAANFLVNGSSEFRARIDSGATGTSINAANIAIVDEAESMHDNKGKQITFDIVDSGGNETRIQSKIDSINKVTTPQGVEYRYVVPLTLTWNGATSIVSVNLRDRSRMAFKLLIGRNWLDNHAVIDVAPKKTIGEIADFIVDGDMKFSARVDTGAASTSINTGNIVVEDASEKMSDNVGKMISFDITNNNGDSKRITSTINKVTKVSNSISSEYRYEVKMAIEWQGSTQLLAFNLKDRSKLSFKLLIGRDWIGDNAIVNTAEKAQ